MSPFRSDSQRRFAFATKQDWAEEFAKATPKGANLPDHVKHGVGKPTKGKKPKGKQKRSRG